METEVTEDMQNKTWIGLSFSKTGEKKSLYLMNDIEAEQPVVQFFSRRIQKPTW